jgi:hypothetical protein
MEAPSLPGTKVIRLVDVDMVSADEGWAVGSQLGPGGATEAAVLHYMGGDYHGVLLDYQGHGCGVSAVPFT